MDEGLLKELTLPFDCPELRELDIHALRAAFAHLMDQAAEAVHAAGLEQDDCVLERYADLAVPPEGSIHTVEVDMLSDRDLCIRALHERIPPGAPVSLAIVALRLHIIRGAMLDPFGLGPR